MISQGLLVQGNYGYVIRHTTNPEGPRLTAGVCAACMARLPPSLSDIRALHTQSWLSSAPQAVIQTELTHPACGRQFCGTFYLSVAPPRGSACCVLARRCQPADFTASVATVTCYGQHLLALAWTQPRHPYGSHWQGGLMCDSGEVCYCMWRPWWLKSVTRRVLTCCCWWDSAPYLSESGSSTV